MYVFAHPIQQVELLFNIFNQLVFLTAFHRFDAHVDFAHVRPQLAVCRQHGNKAGIVRAQQVEQGQQNSNPVPEGHGYLYPALAHAAHFHQNLEQVVIGNDAYQQPIVVYHRQAAYAALKHEQYVTSLINAIYAAAQEAHDYRTVQFLDWFVKEQGEEEKNSSDMITKMELFGSDAKALYMLNSELAGRVYSAPSLQL